MKAIINGKLYDTQTAEELAGDSYGCSGDFERWDETLYRTKSGSYFIAGSGGPKTKYMRVVGQNEWSGGHAIIPLSEEEAKVWMEQHATADEYEAAFGPAKDA